MLVFWLFGPSPLVGQIANLVFAAASFLLTLGVASMLFADKIVGRIAVLILTLYPNQIGYVPTLATEVFYTALLLLACFIVIRDQRPVSLVLSGIVFGVVPALRHASHSPAEVLRGGGKGTAQHGGASRTRGALVVAEVALSVVLLTGATGSSPPTTTSRRSVPPASPASTPGRRSPRSPREPLGSASARSCRRSPSVTRRNLRRSL